MRLYSPPKKEFLMLPNSVFDMPLDVYAFKIYAYYENKDLAVPLVENKEFRSIKNAVINAVMEIPLEPEIQPVEPVPEVSDHIKELYEELLGEPYPDSADDSEAEQEESEADPPEISEPETPMKEPTVHQTMAAAGNIIAALAKLIEDKCMTHQRSLEGQIDHRLRSVINEKKQALGLKIERTQKPTYQTEEDYEMSR